MRRFGIYSLLAIVTGLGLWYATRHIDVRAVDAFYGIAQTPETEITFNYPIEVREVAIRAGDAVDSGAVLLIAERARAQERVADQEFRIDELRADQAINRQRLLSDRNRLNADYQANASALREERARVEADLAYRRRLVASVGGDTSGTVAYRPLEARIQAIDKELATTKNILDTRLADIDRELSLAGRPADAQARRLLAERQFDLDQASVRFEIRAPIAGVVGSINVKVGEHKSSFAPLLTFYEPHPTQVLSYIHEDKLLAASVGDSVWVISLANPSYRARGVITGMGSRIVEIPRRLRRMEEIAIYGREIVVALPSDNPFLQQEKVALNFYDDAG